MTLSSVLYLTDVISSIDNVLGTIQFIYMLSIVVCLFIYIMSSFIENEPSEMAKKILTLLYKKLWLFLIILSVQVLIPTKQTMYLMLGANYLQQSNLPGKVSEVLELKLDDIIKQLKDKK
jgi:hypothetical protein